jgi:hypothetical protein
MARYSVTVRTPMTGQAAFMFMADLRNFAAWDPGVTRVAQVEGLGGGPNSSFDVAVVSGRRELTLRYVTKQYVEPRLVVIEARTRLLTSLDRISISEDAEPGCLVIYDAELKLNGPLHYVDFAVKPMFKRIGERAASGLVAALSGEVVPS